MRDEPNSYASLGAGIGLGCIGQEEVSSELIEIAHKYPNSNAAESALIGIGIISAKGKNLQLVKNLISMKPNVGEALGFSLGLAGLQNPLGEISERLRQLLATNPSQSVGIGLGLVTASTPHDDVTNVMIDYLKNNPSSDACKGIGIGLGLVGAVEENDNLARLLIDFLFKDPSTPAACGAAAGLSVMAKRVGENISDALVSLLQRHPESAAADYVCGSFGLALAKYPEKSRRIVELLKLHPTAHGAGCMGWCLGVVGAITKDVEILNLLITSAQNHLEGPTIDGLGVGIGMMGTSMKEERIINSLNSLLETNPTLRFAEGAAVGLGLIGSQYQRERVISILENALFNLPDKWAGHGAGIGIGFASSGSQNLSISRACLRGIQQFHSSMRSKWLGISLGLIHSPCRNILPHDIQSKSIECLAALLSYGFLWDWSFLSCALTSIAETLGNRK